MMGKQGGPGHTVYILSTIEYESKLFIHVCL